MAKLLSEADALILPLRNFGTSYLGISSKLYSIKRKALLVDLTIIPFR